MGDDVIHLGSQGHYCPGVSGRDHTGHLGKTGGRFGFKTLGERVPKPKATAAQMGRIVRLKGPVRAGFKAQRLNP